MAFPKGNKSGHRFQKGDPDGTINKKGRPKAFDFIRNLAQQIAAEVDPIKKKINAEIVLRKLMEEDGAKFIEIAYGKVPDKLTISTEPDNELVIKVIEVKQ